jgi:TPR repeat protein
MPADPRGALTLFQRLCDKGNLPSCSNVAVAYVTGKGGIPQDVARAVAVVTPACQKDEPSACYVLGGIYLSFDAYVNDRAQVVSLFRRACEGGHAASCDALGVLYAGGTGVASDPSQAARLFQRACDEGSPQACTHLAQLRSESQSTQDAPVITRSDTRTDSMQ